MGAPTLRTALERLICNHPYDPSARTCRCVVARATADDTIAPLTREEHAAHVATQVLHTLNGSNTVLGQQIPEAV